MLVVREGVDGGDLRVVRELLDVALGEGAEHSAVNHAAHHAGGVLDRLAAAKLNLAGRQENDLAAQLADADLEGDAGARGGLGEDHGPGLAGQRQLGVLAAFLLQLRGVGQDGVHVRAGQLLDA